MLNNVPLVGQSLAQTRDLIATNFSTIDTAFSVNHVPYDTSGPSSQGLHQFVQFPTGTPVRATAASQVALYSKVGSLSGIPELYFQRDTLAANSGYPITEKLATTPGWTTLPSGILIQWGSFNGTGSNPYTITFPRAFSTVFSFTANANTPGGFYVIDSLIAASATIRSSASSVGPGYFIAIGN